MSYFHPYSEAELRRSTEHVAHHRATTFSIVTITHHPPVRQNHHVSRRHTSAYDDEANPFFGTVEEAEAFFDQQAEAADDPERYAAMSLYKAQTRKIEDATAVLTDQAGIQDFMPDGGP